jgi:hypothetical protein
MQDDPSMSAETVAVLQPRGSPRDYQVTAEEPSQHGEVIQKIWRAGGMGSAGGAHSDAARYQWFYLHNPEGSAAANILRHAAGDIPIGFLGIGRRRLWLGSEFVAAGTLVDFVVDPSHRTVFPAMLLQRKGREFAMQSMQVLIGLPDKKAVPVCNRLDRHVNFPLPRFARVLRAKSYFERWLPAWLARPLAYFSDALDLAAIRLRLLLTPLRGEWTRTFDSKFDRLWGSLEKRGMVLGVRDEAFLRWRFEQQPGHDYLVFAIRRKAAKELLMYFVCEQSDYGLAVKDCLNIGSERELCQGLLMLSLEARRMGANVLDIQIAAPKTWSQALRRANFVWRSDRPFFAVVAEPLRERAADGLHWYITQADEDI